MKTSFQAALSLGLLLLPLACAQSDSSDGAVDDPDGGKTSACAVDDQNKPEKAVELVLGQPLMQEEFICPRADVDWFKFTLPAGMPLVKVDLTFAKGTATPIELAYDIYADDGMYVMPLAHAEDTVTTDNRSELHERHYLGLAGGVFYLVVRDGGNDDQDTRNAYQLMVSATTDPDPNEPNNDCASAKPLVAGTPQMGTIGYTGDKDAFKLNIPAGAKVLDLSLSTTTLSNVKYFVSVLSADGNAILTKEKFLQAGAASVHIRYGLVSTGQDLCITVEDNDGTASDPAVPYTISAMVLQETDPNEQTQRNDLPAKATPVPAGGGSFTGVIFSKGDLDWYKITAQPKQIVSISLDCAGCAPGIQPAISLVYPHATSPCAAGSTCDFLLEGGAGAMSCNLDTDCTDSGVCRMTPQGKRCGLACNGNFDCPGLTCQQTAGIKSCVAAATCTGENLCGVLQYTQIANPNTGSIRTAQPILMESGGTLYVLVHDNQDDQFSPSTYTLNLSVANDPDGNEPNDFYQPYIDLIGDDMMPVSVGTILDAGRDKATRINWTPNGNGTQSAHGQGCISYQRDSDIFRLVGGDPCTGTGHCGLQITYDRPGGPVDLAYAIGPGPGNAIASFAPSQEGMETVFGDAVCAMPNNDSECMYYSKDDSGDYFLVVRDLSMNQNWDLDPAHCYHFTITSAAAPGCPAACPMVDPVGRCHCN